MSLVCKTLVLVESPQVLKMIAEAFPPSRYDLEFVDDLEGAVERISSKHVDMVIIDSKFTCGEEMNSIKRAIPTMIVEQDYVEENFDANKLSPSGGVFDTFEEVAKIKTAGDKLLRKNYINWIVNALEYFPTGMYSDS